MPVSGAFHTPLMQSARREVATALQKITIQETTVNVYSNVDHRKHTRVPAIIKNIAKQITSPVQWEQLMHVIYQRSPGSEFPTTYEVGPGQQLGTLLKMTNKKAFQNNYHHVGV